MKNGLKLSFSLNSKLILVKNNVSPLGSGAISCWSYRPPWMRSGFHGHQRRNSEIKKTQTWIVC